MKKEIKNIEASVRAKLTNKAEETRQPFAEEICDEKSNRQALWSTFLAKSKIKNVPVTLSETAKLIEAFLEKPIKACVQKKGFDGKWKAPGPWL